MPHRPAFHRLTVAAGQVVRRLDDYTLEVTNPGRSYPGRGSDFVRSHAVSQRLFGR